MTVTSAVDYGQEVSYRRNKLELVLCFGPVRLCFPCIRYSDRTDGQYCKGRYTAIGLDGYVYLSVLLLLAGSSPVDN